MLFSALAALCTTLAIAGGHWLPLAAVDQTAPPFKAQSTDGTLIDLAQLRGSVVLVDFWATWCEPCKVSLPRYAAMQRKHAAAGLRILAVSVDEDEDNLKRFLGSLKIGLTVIHDKGGYIVELYEPPKMPTAYLIGRDGKIVYVHQGFNAGEEVAVEAAVVRALGAADPTKPKVTP